MMAAATKAPTRMTATTPTVTFSPAVSGGSSGLAMVVYTLSPPPRGIVAPRRVSRYLFGEICAEVVMGRTLNEVLEDLPAERRQRIEARAQELLQLVGERGADGDDAREAGDHG